jgi:hypothetical protein
VVKTLIQAARANSWLIAASVVLVAAAAFAQSSNLGPVIQADKGWVAQVWAGPICDFFSMSPSDRTWAVARGTPMHDGVLNAANQNKTDWQYYVIMKKLGMPLTTPPTVVVSASTSPSLPGSTHPGYDQVTTYQASETICGGANGSETPTQAAIAILPASGY